ncbi:hypothetical protein GTW64_33650 [Streptomyces sp. SID4923]|nr:hypothetical protein [Streptomyces sp. SID4923]
MARVRSQSETDEYAVMKNPAGTGLYVHAPIELPARTPPVSTIRFVLYMPPPVAPQEELSQYFTSIQPAGVLVAPHTSSDVAATAVLDPINPPSTDATSTTTARPYHFLTLLTQLPLGS